MAPSRTQHGNQSGHPHREADAASLLDRAEAATRRATDRAEEAAVTAAERFAEVLERKPAWRGWIHASFAPVAFAAGIVLIVLAGGGALSLACAVFALTSVILFGVSGMYHRAYWPDRTRMVFKRLDHSNISLIIAGTYTPFALTLLEGRQRVSLLVIVWVGALLGVAFRTFWVHAPRWLYTPIYVALGWVAIFYAGPLHAAGGTLVMTLIAAGGILYTLGAVVYGFKRPDPWPRVFGFHEIFHACTVAAFIAHFIAAAIVLTR